MTDMANAAEELVEQQVEDQDATIENSMEQEDHDEEQVSTRKQWNYGG